MNNDKNTTRKLNVLVVDDNEDMCKVISSILQVKGCDTNVVHSCEDALKVIKASMPDIVCCGMRLNGKSSGIDLARAIRGDKDVAGIFLIAVSDSRAEKEKEEALQAGFDMFFPKPVKFGDMTRAVEAYCGKVNFPIKGRSS